MNIFLLSFDYERSAKYHCDTHVVKMILEYCQLLYTAWLLSFDAECKTDLEWDTFHIDNKPYKKTHMNHPSAIWIRNSAQNYNWLAAHAKVLCEEYTQRYGKTHKCEEKILFLFNRGAPKSYPQEIKTKLDDGDYRVTNVGLPSGCNNFYMAIAPDVFELCKCVDKNGNVHARDTYRKYYILKGSTMFKRPIKWGGKNKKDMKVPKWYPQNQKRELAHNNDNTETKKIKLYV